MLNDHRARLLRTAIGLGLLMTTLPAFAQEHAAPPAATGDIVVVGQRDQDKQIRDFVRGMTRASGTETLARWDAGESCPQTFGLSPSDNQAITDRIRRVATAARIELAPIDCHRANVVVIFADDKKAMEEVLRKLAPHLFLDGHGDRLRIANDDSPAVAWHIKGLVDRDGRALYAADGEPYVLTTKITPSRIESMVRPEYLTSIVIIERKGVVGLTTTQLADYATMRAYSDANPDRAAKSGAPTILTVLSAPMESETPRSITTWDLALLKGLYAAPKTLYSGAQQGAIATTMKQELSGGKP